MRTRKEYLVLGVAILLPLVGNAETIKYTSNLADDGSFLEIKAIVSSTSEGRRDLGNGLESFVLTSFDKDGVQQGFVDSQSPYFDTTGLAEFIWFDADGLIVRWQLYGRHSDRSSGACFACWSGYKAPLSAYATDNTGTSILLDNVGSWKIESSALVVNIDVKPGSDPNCFKVNGHGVIPVAVLGGDSFDVTNVDQATLLFGGLGVRVRGNKGPLCSLEDSNGDGFLDMVCQFEDNSDYWTSGDGDATLSGKLYDETDFEGTDSICIVP